MPEQLAPREQGILYKAFQQQGAGQNYQNMDPRGRLGLLQSSMQQGQQPSGQDMEILKRLRAEQENQNAPQGVAQLAPQGGEGMLSRLFKMLSGGLESVDPLADLKRPGFAGRPSQ